MVPSLIIGYSPCEMHSIKKGGMQNCQMEMKKAVECGYWNLFRFNPAAPTGKKFTLDSKEPKGGYQDFLMNEGPLHLAHPLLPRARQGASSRRTRRPPWLATRTCLSSRTSTPRCSLRRESFSLSS